MWEAFAKALSSGLGLWESKEKRKYIDKLIKLRRQHYEEINKDKPDHRIIDELEFELCLLSEAFSSKVREKDPIS
tara:strand:- start:302 stop:526 length:225 start_codon:yes stop_codon:yes gene_type:complete